LSGKAAGKALSSPAVTHHIANGGVVLTCYDFVVLGSGPAGRRAAVQAAKLGKSVLVVDSRSRVGGVSVHTGTIPSKTLRETVLNLSGWRERSFYGQSYRVKGEISGEDLSNRMQKTLDHEVEVLEHQFARNGVTIVQGEGRFLDPHRLLITSFQGAQRIEQEVVAGHILIAVGTYPYRPAHIPFNGTSVLDSDDFILNPQVPRSLTVVGAGVIGLEYATIFSALDVKVTLIEPRETILDFMDREIVQNLVYQMRNRGIVMRMSGEIEHIGFTASGQPVCHLRDGRQVTSEVVLFAAGRVGATQKLALNSCGLETDPRGRIAVDPATFQTAIPHIYAAGDVIGFPSLASVSMEQGRTAACHAFGQSALTCDQHFPLGIYSVPELSSVGLTEEQVRARSVAYECGIAHFRETSRGHIMGLDSGVLKMVVCAATGRVLGVHIIGEGATELIHIGQAVINLKATVEYFIENSFNYPTLAEAYKIAALDVWNSLNSRRKERCRSRSRPASSLRAV
jgi:NAD(P) transhydrogenase